MDRNIVLKIEKENLIYAILCFYPDAQMIQQRKKTKADQLTGLEYVALLLTGEHFF